MRHQQGPTLFSNGRTDGEAFAFAEAAGNGLCACAVLGTSRVYSDRLAVGFGCQNVLRVFGHSPLCCLIRVLKSGRPTCGRRASRGPSVPTLGRDSRGWVFGAGRRERARRSGGEPAVARYFLGALRRARPPNAHSSTNESFLGGGRGSTQTGAQRRERFYQAIIWLLVIWNLCLQAPVAEKPRPTPRCTYQCPPRCPPRRPRRHRRRPDHLPTRHTRPTRTVMRRSSAPAARRPPATRWRRRQRERRQRRRQRRGRLQPVQRDRF